MSDRIFLPAAAALAILLIALSLVWPQGYGRRSPAPFGSRVLISAATRQDQARATKARANAKAVQSAKADVAARASTGSQP